MTPPTVRPPAIRRAALAAVLGCLLFAVYLLTFSGVLNTDDERYIVDTTESIAVRGSLALNETSYLRPVQNTDVEPAQPLLSVPLYWLAFNTPHVGNVHAVMLLSPIVTALTGALLFLYALDLGYGERTAIAAGLLFGLTTIAWPYAKTYFREPLTTLLLFGVAFFLNRWRDAFRARSPHQWTPLALAIGALLLALLSKEAALIALPVLILLAYPGRITTRERRRQIAVIVLGLLAVACVFGLAMFVFRSQLAVLATRYSVLTRLVDLLNGLPDAGAGVAGYLISPGKGIWWYSPVLLLALGAPFVLPRARWREAWLPLALTLMFALSYAAVRGPRWSGGFGWGARYMLPLVPFLMIAALPLVDRLLNGGLWARLGLAALAALGLAVQIGGTFVSLTSYYTLLENSLDTPPWLGPAIWSFHWSQAFGSLLAIGRVETDIRWLIPPHADGLALAVLSGGVLLLALILGLILTWGRAAHRRLAVALAGAPLLVIGLAAFALVRAYDDPRYLAGYEPLIEMRHTLETQTAPGDIILLSNPSYVPHFMNYYKGRTAWYSLPLAPGERHNPDDPLLERYPPSGYAGLRALEAAILFTDGGELYQGGPIWLVGDLGPALPWATRPVEWWFSWATYPVEAIDFSERARLVKYLPLLAPEEDYDPIHRVDAQFGEGMALLGYDATTADYNITFDALHPGDMLGVSLLWQAVAPMGVDYTVAMQLIGPDGLPVLQHDRAPVGGLRPTTGWEQDEMIRDNFGFILPDDLPPGRYEVWLIVYEWPSLERLPISGEDGEALGDHLALTAVEVTPDG